MKTVFTTKGYLPYDELDIRDVVAEDDNSRAIATEWYYKGELVRRDAAVSILRPAVMGAEQGDI